MFIRPLPGREPSLSPSARAAETAAVIGGVTIEDHVSIWYGAVLRGDADEIRIGSGSNIQDNCTVHCAAGLPTVVGRNVVVGHGAILHSCTLQDGCLVGMGAVVLDGSVVGAGSIIGAGALVPPGRVIPPRSLVMGVPGRIVRQVTEEEAAATLENAARYVRLGAEQLPPAPDSAASI